MDIINRNDVQPFITKDTSIIREILAPANSCITRQSLAEASLPSGATTVAHAHPNTEEIYYILSGHGLMRIGEDERTVQPGDGIAIPPGLPHQIRCASGKDLVFLCCCVPAYSHEDTVLFDSLFE